MTKLRVVLDANVLISGFLWIGPPHEIIKLAENKYIILCLSSSIVEETLEVLSRPKFASRIKELNTTSEELIESLLNVAEIVHPSQKLLVIKDDPDDNKIVECAIAAAADFIVSGDLHLLKQKELLDVRIVTPQKFLKILRQTGD